jgi:hypothetical protein
VAANEEMTKLKEELQNREGQRHGHWFSTTICMESSKSVVDGPFDESYINISAMT